MQVMMMVGVNPVADALGRVNKLEVIPIEELGRPRVDVVVNCSGVFRDLFVNQVGAEHAAGSSPAACLCLWAGTSQWVREQHAVQAVHDFPAHRHECAVN